MKRFYTLLFSALAFALVAMQESFAHATATWSVDVSSVSADVVTVGTAVLAIVALILGYRLIRGMASR